MASAGAPADRTTPRTSRPPRWRQSHAGASGKQMSLPRTSPPNCETCTAPMRELAAMPPVGGIGGATPASRSNRSSGLIICDAARVSPLFVLLPAMRLSGTSGRGRCTHPDVNFVAPCRYTTWVRCAVGAIVEIRLREFLANAERAAGESEPSRLSDLLGRNIGPSRD
jgi:hypothetical protein